MFLNLLTGFFQVTSTTVASAASRVGHDSHLSKQGVSILDRAGLLGQAMPNFPGSERSRAQLRLLLLMNETEPPAVPASSLVSLVVARALARVGLGTEPRRPFSLPRGRPAKRARAWL